MEPLVRTWLENGAQRYHRLSTDCVKAVAEQIQVADDDLRPWLESDSGEPLRHQWAGELAEIAHSLVGPVWEPASSVSDRYVKELLRILEHPDPYAATFPLDKTYKEQLERADTTFHAFTAENLRLWNKGAQHFERVLSDARLEPVANVVRHKYDSRDLTVVWEWFGGFTTERRAEPDDYRDHPERWERSSPGPNGYYSYRPVDAPPYLRAIAMALWASKWEAEAERQKEGADRGLALVAQTARSRAPLERFPLPTDPTAVRVATVMSGGVQGGESIGGERIAQPSAILVKWADEDSPVQLAFPWNGNDRDGGPLVEIARRYGSDALAFLLSAITIHWTQGDITNDPHARIALYPSEVAWLMGVPKLRPSWEHYADLFGRTILTARYPDGGTEEGPFLQVAMTTRNGRGGVESVWASLHPALTYPSAKGRFYWPAHRRLLRSDISTGHRADSHALAVLFGQQWSLSLSNKREIVFSKTATSLAEQLGIRTRPDRKHDSRMLDRLTRAIAPLEAEGYVDRFEIVDGVVRAWPGEKRDEKPKRVSRLPSTGAELSRWVAENGGPTEAARLLGKGRATIYRAMNLSHRQIPPSVRTAIRDYCWSTAETDDH